MRPVFWLNLAVKAVLVGLLLFAVSGAEQFEGKAMEGRALTYPLAAVVVPLAWWLWGRRRRWEYPYTIDIIGWSRRRTQTPSATGCWASPARRSPH